MPNYEYNCKECGKTFFAKKSMNDESTPACPVCESLNVNKVWGDVNIKTGTPYGGVSSSCGGCSGSCGCGH